MRYVFIILGFFSCFGYADMFTICKYKDTFDLSEINKIEVSFEKSEVRKTLLFENSSKELLIDNITKLYNDLYQLCIDKQLDGINLSKLSNQDLHKIYTLIHKIYFYTSKDPLIDLTIKILLEKNNRNEDISHLIKKAYLQISKQWDLSLLDKFKESFPDHNFQKAFEIIDINNAGERTLLTPVADGKVKHESFSIPKEGNYVIITSSPYCNASKRFTKWLKENKNIRISLENKTKWIISDHNFLSIPDVIEYNSPLVNMQFVPEKNEWPEITYWGTPTLYFYSNGKLKKQLIGWPQEGNEEKLIESLKEIGRL